MGVQRDDAERAASGGHDTTVAVVGAGLSGLTAARELHRAGVEVIVLEAAERLGGRALTVTSALGSRLDLGGQWIGHDHSRIMALAAELGATQFRMHTSPLPVVIDGSRRLRAGAPSMLGALLVLAGVEVLSRVATTQRWNTTTVEAWLRRLPRRIRRLLEVLAYISWTADLDRYSIHAMAKAIRQQGGLRAMLSTTGGAQESLLVEGAGALIDGLAGELGSRVRPGHRVTSIVCRDGGVTVHTTAGDVRAAKVIVTVPPPIAGRIAYDPPLPPSRAALASDTYMGSVYKGVAVYPRPFWRDRVGGEFLVLDKPGRAVFDTSAPGGPGHLCVLVGGPEARELDRLDAPARRDAVLGALAAYVGPEVLDPASWHEKSWHLDEYVGGGYVALAQPGTSGGIPPIACTPVGDIHWAGSETARDHPGYLDGAIESGTRVAREVIEALTGSE
ncbi:flavin monoamine oxidase family protein [Mycolicibacter longobardus]|uniref:Amine oxidase n=1 Tax=Mycolicibacter longobardus TaxID=1108812 RepID=A0A1X1YQN1_9MYCO|nr:FAD-dependent oxidoreductase [Mycolicibacter longobardus]ORW13426.1 amine oxidase [Mycolicibacter longobardus]